jgi:Polymer-forming cytoskeletal
MSAQRRATTRRVNGVDHRRDKKDENRVANFRACLLPDDRVTVGRNGRGSASIAARDIVVLGEVLGSCKASDHFDIRCEGSLYGDVVVSRISVEEGLT